MQLRDEDKDKVNVVNPQDNKKSCFESSTELKVKVLTLFPELYPGALGLGVVGRALEQQRWDLEVINIRDFATDKYGSVDDRPFGGGAGMVLRSDILELALQSLGGKEGLANYRKIYVTPRGQLWNQEQVRLSFQSEDLQERSTGKKRLKQMQWCLLAGRYEGVDERLLREYDFELWSVGDYVLSAGDLPIMTMLDSVLRHINGTLNNKDSILEESLDEKGLLEYPVYTRPRLWKGLSVPDVLMSGHHGRISHWKKEQSCLMTQKQRPDLWRRYLQKLSLSKNKKRG